VNSSPDRGIEAATKKDVGGLFFEFMKKMQNHIALGTQGKAKNMSLKAFRLR